MKTRAIALIILCITSVFSGLDAQNLSAIASNFEPPYVAQYFQPVVEIIPMGMNLGHIHTPTLTSDKFHIDIGMVVSVIPIIEKHKNFILMTPESLGTPQEASVASFFGENEHTSINLPNGHEYVSPGGFDFNSIILGVPQLRIGNILGTDFHVRYSNYNFGNRLNEVRLFGVGLRHSIDSHFDGDLFAFSIAYDYSRFKLDSNLEGNSHAGRVMIGMKTEVFTAHAFGAYIKSEGSIRYYSYTEERSRVANFSNNDNILAGVGGSVKIWKIYLNSELSVYPFFGVSFGTGLIL